VTPSKSFPVSKPDPTQTNQETKNKLWLVLEWVITSGSHFRCQKPDLKSTNRNTKKWLTFSFALIRILIDLVDHNEQRNLLISIQATTLADNRTWPNMAYVTALHYGGLFDCQY